MATQRQIDFWQGEIAGLYEFAPDAKGVDNGEVEAPAENGQPDLEVAEA